MKFSLARPALALAVSLTLASCGGGKATFPIHVTVSNVLYDGLVLSTNGMDLTVSPPAATSAGVIPDVTLTFPNEIEYGQTYNVIPKGQVTTDSVITATGAQPKHQTCSSTTFPADGTAGQLATIDVRYTCLINSYALTGTVTGLTADGLVLTNGSTGGSVTVAANATTVTMASVPYNTTFGVTVLTQPTGLTCKVTGGNSTADNGSGIMDDTAEAAGGVSNLAVTCNANPT
jgi:hypothetical protein